MEDFDHNKYYTGAVLKKSNGREVWVIIGVKSGKNVIYLTSTDSDNYDCNSSVCCEISPNLKNGLAKPIRFKLIPRYSPLQKLKFYCSKQLSKHRITRLNDEDVQSLCQKLTLLNPE